MDFIQTLKAQLEKVAGEAPPWGDVNPLVIIGLSEAILDLGLPEDQLYATIRSYGRQLAAQVHPDRNLANVSPQRQRDIIGAFGILDDRQNFTRALTHFRTLKAEDRRESRILGQALTSLRNQLAGLEAEFNAVKESRQQIEKERHRFERRKREEPLKIPGFEATIKTLETQLDFSNKSLETARRNTSNWKRKFEHAMAYIAYIGEVADENPLAISAFDAKWVAVASLWPMSESHPSPFKKDGKVREKFRENALSLGIEEQGFAKILTAWNKAVADFGTPGKLEDRQLPLGLSIIKLQAGKSTLVEGNRPTAGGGRVIGSLPPDKLPITRTQLVHGISHDVIFETLHPFIVPGGLLLSVFVQKHRRASWSTTCPAFRFSTRRLILAVG